MYVIFLSYIFRCWYIWHYYSVMIYFVTKGATSAFMLSDLLEKGESGNTYKLTHDGKTVAFTLGEKMTDVSAILTKP